MTNVIDVSRNKETGDITQFTIISSTGQPELKKATPENLLLYDPADELPFDDGMSGFLSGNEALVLQEDDPTIMVAPTSNDYCYILRVRDNTVETTPNQAERVLSGIRDAVIDGEVEPLIDLYDHIMSTQVRRDVVNALHQTFDEAFRIAQTSNGWLVDDFYLVDWSASMYAKHDDPDEADKIRSGGGVTETDKSYEFVQLQLRRDTEPVEVSIHGETYRLTEREMLFLAKIKWLLNRRHYHPDQPFWMFADKRASVDWKTGEPEQEESEDEDDGPDLDSFEL
jgi:hypothetical protein